MHLFRWLFDKIFIYYKVMIYLSIPVHEKIPVIINQVENIKRFLPCTVVLHVSKSAKFTNKELEKSLSNIGYHESVFVNDISVETVWGSIISAHLENLNYIKKLGARAEDKVIFMASNDMLIRPGCYDLVKNSEFIFHLRKCEHARYWWPALVANKDIGFIKAIAKTGGSRIYASQIEGSMYPFGVLQDINKIIKINGLLNSDLFYDRAEFYFSSLTAAMGYTPSADPFIFAEFHRFDSKLWKMLRICDRTLPDELSGYLKKIINKLYFLSRLYSISKDDVLAIKNGTLKLPELYDGSEFWHPYTDIKKIFGVKRVPRNLNNNLRKFITNME